MIKSIAEMCWILADESRSLATYQEYTAEQLQNKEISFTQAITRLEEISQKMIALDNAMTTMSNLASVYHDCENTN